MSLYMATGCITRLSLRSGLCLVIVSVWCHCLHYCEVIDGLVSRAAILVVLVYFQRIILFRLAKL